ncbi:short-chain dehydrogenase/reductase SDR [Thraustotheca clavata]|uniref:Short-chain dehydrogenase/reductase SDR n=1 Tax=Thraustotheca clavata TaxID=74557 RepID=A0A1V9ZW76_9STRA|nr:short-chain dehydrogenase/reductase SDR [Thraustotheca clavata]
MFPHALKTLRSVQWTRNMATDAFSKKCVLVVGAGDSTGAEIARVFARDGYTACCVRRDDEKAKDLAAKIRDEGFAAEGFGVDCRIEENVQKLVEDIENRMGPIEVAVFNVGANVRFPITETTSRVYRKVWEMACFSGFLLGREAAARMLPRGRGTILFTGATASVRGGAQFAAFSGAKFALRALSQSMARELSPKGIHVAHVVIDGPIDTPWIHENFPQAQELKKVDGLLSPEEIAKMYLQIHKQHRSVWTHEVDVRPWNEKW